MERLGEVDVDSGPEELEVGLTPVEPALEDEDEELELAPEYDPDDEEEEEACAVDCAVGCWTTTSSRTPKLTGTVHAEPDQPG